jgi:hypothetical protein
MDIRGTSSNPFLLLFTTQKAALHCNEPEGEIPVPSLGAAGRQRPTAGKYFQYEGRLNTCLVPA